MWVVYLSDSSRRSQQGLLPGGAIALWLNAVEAVLQWADEHFTAVVSRHFGLLYEADGRHQGLYGAAIVRWTEEEHKVELRGGPSSGGRESSDNHSVTPLLMWRELGLPLTIVFIIN